jgi:hypothetical protein
MRFSIIFTTIFLTANHLYSTFASPIASEGSVAAGKSHNLTHSLAKRVTPPADQLCRQPSDWVGRMCLYTVNDRAWADRCVGDDHVKYWRHGQCPPNLICMNKLGGPELLTITCIGRPSEASTSGSNQQTGVVPVTNAASIRPAEKVVSVGVDKVISLASVSAMIEGMCPIPH